jgi:diacylglycerol kinase (ATP)
VARLFNQFHKNSGVQGKIRIFLSGLRWAVLGDSSVAWQMAISLVVLGVSFWLREWLDFLLILIVTGYMLITEIFNSVIEALCDYVQPEHDPKIGAIKDIAAFAAGISVLLWIAALLFEIVRIWILLGSS